MMNRGNKFEVKIFKEGEDMESMYIFNWISINWVVRNTKQNTFILEKFRYRSCVLLESSQYSQAGERGKRQRAFKLKGQVTYLEDLDEFLFLGSPVYTIYSLISIV